MKNEIPVYDISNVSSFCQEDIFVGRFGIYSINHKHLHYAHRHNFYHIVFFTEGSGTQAIDFQNFEVRFFRKQAGLTPVEFRKKALKRE